MRFSAIGQALLDRKGAIVDANPALAAIFGTDTDELVGSMFGAHFIDAQDEARRSRELAALAEGVFRTTRQWRSRAGELRPAQLPFAPVPGEHGQVAPKREGSGKCVSVRVDLGGASIN